MFVTLYGINNIGKSTQALMLVEHFKKLGLKVKYLKFPIYDLSPSGVFLHTVLRSKVQTITEAELQMWFALNRYQFENHLKDNVYVPRPFYHNPKERVGFHNI